MITGKRARKMESRTLYAVVDQKGGLLLFDGRAPIYWLRKVAKAAATEYDSENARVIPVAVKPVIKTK